MVGRGVWKKKQLTSYFSKGIKTNKTAYHHHHYHHHFLRNKKMSQIKRGKKKLIKLTRYTKIDENLMYYLYFIRAEWTIFLDQGQIKKQHLKSTFSPCSWTLSKSLKRLLKLYETLPLETFWRIWSHVPYICLYTYALTYTSVAAAAKSLQLCPTLCDPIDGSPLGTSVPGILQARTLEWIAISFSNAWKWKVKVKSLSCATDS